MKPSYLIDIPADEYHAATKNNEYTTSHRLNLFRRCPALYHKHIMGEIVEGDTSTFIFGRATHTFVIEGETAFASEYIVAEGPINAKTGKAFGRETKAFKEWAAEQDKPIILPEDFDLLTKMRMAVQDHKIAADLLGAGYAEQTIRTNWLGEPVQARLDWFDPDRGIIVDLKTCADVDRFRFDVRDFGYIHQLAFYRSVIEKACASADIPLSAYLIAVEKKEPYRVAVVEVGILTLDDVTYNATSTHGPGNECMLRELQKCRIENVWPTRYEHLITI